MQWEQEVQRLVALAGAQEANLRVLVRANDSVFLDPARVGGDVCAPLPQQLGYFLRGQQHDDGGGDGDKEEERRRSAALLADVEKALLTGVVEGAARCDDSDEEEEEEEGGGGGGGGGSLALDWRDDIVGEWALGVRAAAAAAADVAAAAAAAAASGGGGGAAAAAALAWVDVHLEPSAALLRKRLTALKTQTDTPHGDAAVAAVVAALAIDQLRELLDGGAEDCDDLARELRGGGGSMAAGTTEGGEVAASQLGPAARGAATAVVGMLPRLLLLALFLAKLRASTEDTDAAVALDRAVQSALRAATAAVAAAGDDAALPAALAFPCELLVEGCGSRVCTCADAREACARAAQGAEALLALVNGRSDALG